MAVAAALIPRGSRVADVGTDHALLPALLLESKRASFCIASDRSREALDRIAPPVERFVRSGTLQLRHADGLRALRSEDRIDVVVMAGLGAQSMIRMLEAHARACPQLRRLVLEPRTEIGLLRRWLDGRGFGIVDERAVFERGRHYFLLAAEPGKREVGFEYPGLSRDDLYEAGPLLVRSGSEVVRRFWQRQLDLEESILRRGSLGRGHEKTVERRDRAQRVLEALDRVMRTGAPAASF